MYNPKPQAFFGPGYSVASSEIRLKTADASPVTTGGTFTADSENNRITTATAHNVKVNDVVKFNPVGTLPEPLIDDVDYFVNTVISDTEFTVSATKLGETINLSTNGSGANTVGSLSSLSEVTDVEADPDTGDWRKVLFGIVEMAFQQNNNTPSTARSTRLDIRRSSMENSVTGKIIRNYTFRFETDVEGIDVAPEL